MSTAWAFPSPVIEEMIEKYPHLSFDIEGEEESQSYGVHIKYDNGNVQWLEEEGKLYDEHNNREVYYDNEKHLWRYFDNDFALEDSDDFYPSTRYTWS